MKDESPKIPKVVNVYLNGLNIQVGNPLTLPKMIEVGGEKYLSLAGLNDLAKQVTMVIGMSKTYLGLTGTLDGDKLVPGGLTREELTDMPLGNVINSLMRAFVMVADGRVPIHPHDYMEPMTMQVLAKMACPPSRLAGAIVEVIDERTKPEPQAKPPTDTPTSEPKPRFKMPGNIDPSNN